MNFLQRDLEERKICNRRFGRKIFFAEEVWKKEKFARGGLEKRIFPQEEVWKKDKFARAFWKEEFCKRSFGTKQFCEKLQRILQEGPLEEDSRILPKKK
jgi:hypothetical protein